MLHNQILPNKKTKKKLPLILISFGLFAFFCIVSVFGYYKHIFHNFEINANVEHFGQFGDFIGGTLNPILAFLSFMALLYTIKIQTDELKLSREELEATRKELEGSRIAQQEQSDSLKLQNKAAKLQIFESTFFQLLNQHNQYLNLLVKENIKIDYIKYTNSDPFNELSRDGFKSKKQILSEFHETNQTKRTLKNYFMTLFQILKYINNYAKRNDINAKFYTNIIRALIDDEILRLLAINCIAYPEFIEYKKYIEEYAFFEHIYLKESKEEIKTILEILSEYKLGAFDKNVGLISLINKKDKH